MSNRSIQPVTAQRLAWIGCTWIVAIAALGQAPVVGPQIRIDQAPASQPAHAASETSLAAVAIPATAACGITGIVHAIAAWNDSRDINDDEQLGKIRAALTTDGGQTWTESVVLPPAATGTTCGFDPMTAADSRTGRLFVGGVWGIEVCGNIAPTSGLFIASKGPCDSSFGPAVSLFPAPLANCDKPWMAAGIAPGLPNSTRLYVGFNYGPSSTWPMYVAGTDVDSAGNFGAWQLRQIATAGNAGAVPRVGPGGEVYVAYWDKASFHYLARSLDGGNTFVTRSIVERLDFWQHIVGSEARIAGTTFTGFQIPQYAGCLAVSPTNGTLYFSYFDTTKKFGTTYYNVDIWFTKSTDQGDHWTTPRVISQEAPFEAESDQWFTWLEVDAYARLHLVFYSGRGITPDFPVNADGVLPARYHAIYSYSDDGGVSWSESFLTSHPTPQNPTAPNVPWATNAALYHPVHSFVGQAVGHYLGMGVAGNKAIPCYTSLQNGSPGNGNSDIFVNVVTR